MSETCFVHIDLDTIGHVRQCYGLGDGTGEERLPDVPDPAYTEGLVRFLDLFARHERLKATLFVVAENVLNDAHRDILVDAIEEGNEIANHSLSHNFGLCEQSLESIYDDISKADALLKSHLGVTCKGFRAPGYGVNDRLFSALEQANYRYDSSLLPTFFGFAFKIIDRLLSKRLRGKQRPFGRLLNGFLPNHPYRIEGHNLVEVPISTSPIIRFPIHSTVVHSVGLRTLYRALSRLKRSPHPVVYLFHALDLVDVAKMNLFNGKAAPGVFSTPIEQRMNMVQDILSYLHNNFEIVRTDNWIEQQGRDSGDR